MLDTGAAGYARTVWAPPQLAGDRAVRASPASSSFNVSNPVAERALTVMKGWATPRLLSVETVSLGVQLSHP